MHKQIKHGRQTSKLRNAKGVLIEEPKAQKHAQPDKGRQINKRKRREMLEECFLSNQKRATT